MPNYFSTEDRMNWQVQCELAINVDDCKTGEEAIERIKRCLPLTKINSVKNMRIIEIAKPKAIERQKRQP